MAMFLEILAEALPEIVEEVGAEVGEMSDVAGYELESVEASLVEPVGQTLTGEEEMVASVEEVEQAQECLAPVNNFSARITAFVKSSLKVVGITAGFLAVFEALRKGLYAVLPVVPTRKEVFDLCAKIKVDSKTLEQKPQRGTIVAFMQEAGSRAKAYNSTLADSVAAAMGMKETPFQELKSLEDQIWNKTSDYIAEYVVGNRDNANDLKDLVKRNVPVPPGWLVHVADQGKDSVGITL